ncbi:DUF547 domain-containing protein [Costertonia aggregata]|uniref:DUF547 domain-containing protein n=1 Tax=Costertonia aggregata TaxID=343403 RepID=A0A7H9AKJ3_9FLAO|nr:DUF547 domain-containing protein [Costertonia aggregata]QLG44002.1 DUF547 domain-containing protein [Costertonia aggregata]
MKEFSLKCISLSVFIILLSSTIATAQKKIDFNRLSEEFIKNIKEEKSTEQIRETLAGTTLETLENSLRTDDEKLAFWINIYNAYIQVILAKNPELYDDRRTFFEREQIPIAGRMVAFSKIEHGIIRKSQWPLGLGLIRKWFPNKFERKLRVDKRDYRIHFALNCGAKDCPPVAIYEPERLEEQLNKGTDLYLQKTSEYNAGTREVAVTSLFNWFRGDFGCKSGVKDILKEFDIIPTTKKIDITYKNYDWTLELDNWIDL